MVELDRDLAALRDAASGSAPMVSLPLDEVRGRIVAGSRLCSAGPGVRVRDIAAGEDGAPVPLRIYGEPAGTTLVYAHGGGWVTGGLDYADEFCRFLAADSGVQVVNVDYGLAPEHRFPRPLEDLAAAWQWTKVRVGGRLALGGDSAGGNLAAALGLRLRDAGEPPVFQLLLYPVLDLPDATDSYRRNARAFPIGAADMRWFFDHYVDADQRDNAGTDLLPLRAESLAGLPPTHVVLAAHDPLYDEGEAWVDRLCAEGVRVTSERHADLCHGFLRFTGASRAAATARDLAVANVRRLEQMTSP